MVQQIKQGGFLNRLRGGVQGFLNPKPEEKNFPLPIVWNMMRPGSAQPQMVDYEAYAKEGYSRNSIIYGAIKYKLDAISQAPLRAYEGTPDNAVLLENVEHPLYKVAMRPNEYQSRVEFMQYCVLYLNLHGNTFIYQTRGEDGVKPGLYPLRPDRVRIVPDMKGGKKQSNTVIGYAYFPDGITEQRMIPILPEQMLHIKIPNPYDPLEGQGYGLAPLSAGAREADTDNHMTKFLDNYFKNQGIMPGGVIQLPYESNAEDIASLRNQIEEVYGGAGNWGKPLVIDGGGNFSHMVPTFKDMGLDVIDLRNVRRVTTVFGVPGRLLGLDESNSTYNNLAEAKEDFWQNTMFTELLLFEEELRHKVTIGDDVFLRFDVSGIKAFADDTTVQVATFKALIESMVPPHVAARIAGLDIGELEYGDVSFMPSTLIPVELFMNPPAPTPLFGGNPALPPAKQPDKKPAKSLADGTPIEHAPIDGAPFGGIHDGIDDDNEIVHFSQPQTKGMSKAGKEKFRDNLNALKDSHEPAFEAGAKRVFKEQLKAIQKKLDKEKRLHMKAKKSFDWVTFEQWARMYLYSGGLGVASTEMSSLVTTIAMDSRGFVGNVFSLEDTIPDFDTLYMTRSSIEAEAWFANYSLQFATSINDTTFEDIHAVIRDGLASEMGTDEIGGKIGALFEQYMAGGQSPEDWEFMTQRMPAYRLEMIARTETHGAVSASNHYLYQRIGATKKEWLATNDARTRESHIDAERRYTEGGSIGAIPVKDYFYVGGSPMMYPGDKSAPLGEIINCRCVEIPFIPEPEGE